jgi:hypothetical protein
MTVWGISGSDVTNYGWNTAVGFGVVGACAATAYAVRLLAAKVTPPPTKGLAALEMKSRAQLIKYTPLASLVLGLAVAGAAYVFIPNSRFALITDDSTSSMLKLGVLQGIAGTILFVTKRAYSGAIVTLGGVLATRFGNLGLAGLGVVGAVLGAMILPINGSKKP